MKERKHIGQTMISMLLVLALMFPAIVQFSHHFEEHHHEVCTEKSIHFHETELTCQICDFHLSSFNYDTVDVPDLLLSNIPSEVEKHFTASNVKSITNTNNQLRAPPYFLV